jgi:hypothetical protein
MGKRSKPAKRPGRLHRAEARRLVLACGEQGSTAASTADAVTRICGEITDCLEPLITRRATEALLARSVYLSRSKFAILNAVSTGEADADVVRELPPCLRALEADEALEVALEVLAHFVWLLTRFIGDDLGLRLLREACPDLPKEEA